MNKLQKRILKLEYRPNCYLLFSAAKRDPKETYGDFLVKANVSFFYDAGNKGAEWEPEHGPIQVWSRCDSDNEDAQEHYFYDYHNSKPGNWSQLAVDRNQLPQAAHSGDWDYIFAVLEDWAQP